MFLEGYDKLANIIGAIMDGINTYASAFLAIYCKNQNELIPNTIAIVIAGYIASEVGVTLFKKFKKDKPYQFTIKFREIEICEFIKMQLEEQNIESYINRNNKTLKAFSINRQQSKYIEHVIQGRFKNYTVNEFKEYVRVK